MTDFNNQAVIETFFANIFWGLLNCELMARRDGSGSHQVLAFLDISIPLEQLDESIDLDYLVKTNLKQTVFFKDEIELDKMLFQIYPASDQLEIDDFYYYNLTIDDNVIYIKIWFYYVSELGMFNNSDVEELTVPMVDHLIELLSE